MRASLLVVPLLLSCGGGSSTSGGTKPNEPRGKLPAGDTRGFDEYPQDYGADEYGEFPYDYDEGYYGEGYGGDYYGDSEPYVPPPPPPPNLVGTWLGTCKPGAKDSKKLSLVVDASRWDLTIEQYSDTACATRTSAIQKGGAYSFGDASTVATGAWNAVFSFDKHDIVADDKKSAKALGKLCGIKKLAAGSWVSVHDKGCAKLGIKPAADCGGEYDLVTIDGSHLELGVRPADNDLCTEAKRPSAIDTAHFLAFHWPTSGVPECDALTPSFDRIINCPALGDTRSMMLQVYRDQMTFMKDAATCKMIAPQMDEVAKAYGC